MGGMGVPMEKAVRPVRAAAGRLAPSGSGWCCVLARRMSVALNVIGPMILGRATDVIFAGRCRPGLPAGPITAEAAVDAAPPATTPRRR